MFVLQSMFVSIYVGVCTKRGESYAAQIGVTCLRWITNGRDQRINDIALETVFTSIAVNLNLAWTYSYHFDQIWWAVFLLDQSA